MTDQEVWDDLPAAIASTICANVGAALRLAGKRFLSIAEMGELCSGFISQARQGSAERSPRVRRSS